MGESRKKCAIVCLSTIVPVSSPNVCPSMSALVSVAKCLSFDECASECSCSEVLGLGLGLG